MVKVGVQMKSGTIRLKKITRNEYEQIVVYDIDDLDSFIIHFKINGVKKDLPSTAAHSELKRICNKSKLIFST